MWSRGPQVARVPWSPSRWWAPTRPRSCARRLLHLDTRLTDLIARYQPGQCRRRAGVQPAQRPHRDGHRPGRRGGAAGGGAGRPAGGLYTPSEVKAAVTGSGAAGKEQVTAMVTRLLGCPRRLGRPTPPTRWRWRSATLARRHAGPARRRGARREERRSAMIASVRGRVVSVAGDGAVVEVGGVGLGCCAPRRPWRRYDPARSAAGDQPGGARRLAHPLRLRRRRLA